MSLNFLHLILCLYKKEGCHRSSLFDQYRAEGKAHPYLIEHGIDAIPFAHSELDNWRMNQRGIKYHHEATNFIVTGAVDDV